MERIRQISAKAKIDLEGYRLSLVRDGLLSSEAVSRQLPRSSDWFDINNLRLLPRFNEKDQDTFFLLFQCVAKATDWLDADSALMLQNDQGSNFSYELVGMEMSWSVW